MPIIRPARCENCIHWKRTNPIQGECRIKSPHLAVFLVPTPNGQPGNLSFSSWPSSKQDDWCGEHKPGVLQPSSTQDAINAGMQ